MTIERFLDKAAQILDQWDREKDGDRNGVKAAVNAIDLLTKLLPMEIRHLDPKTRAAKAFTTSVLCLLLLPRPAHAQGVWPAEHQRLADTLSTITEGIVTFADVYHDVHVADHKWQVLGCDGLKYGLVEAGVESLKHLTHEERPDHTDFLSFPSGHATNAFAALNGWQLGTSLTLAIGTSYLRRASNRHHWRDVFVGAALGTAINYGVSRIPACRGTVN